MTEEDERPNDVFLAHLHPHEWGQNFARSLFDLREYDYQTSGRLGGRAHVKVGATGIPQGRNAATAAFLESDCEWLWMVDSDMGFAPNALDDLLDAADSKERPIIGGLCFAYKELQPDGLNGYHAVPMPTIFDFINHDDFPSLHSTTNEPEESDRWSDEGTWKYTSRAHYAPSTLVRCDATGAAFLLIHRDVFARLGGAGHEGRWWNRIEDDEGKLLGEDISFFARVRDLDIPLHVHTGIRTNHLKPVYVNEEMFWSTFRPPPAEIETDVIVPIIRAGMAERFVTSLRASTGLARVTAMACEETELSAVEEWEDNGADVRRSTKTGFAAKVNLGFDFTKRPLVYVVGEDVRFHSGWLDHAQHFLRAHHLAVVGTNDVHNDRVAKAQHATHFLIAREYVDTHGASFDGPGVLCHEGYHHWFIDNEIIQTAASRGAFGVAVGSIVEHLNPYLGTAEMDDVYRSGESENEADRILFDERMGEWVP